MRIKRDPKCPVCGEHPTQTKLIDYEAFCGLAANGASANGDTAVPIHPAQPAAAH